jgi:hypothetical protein
MSRLLTAALLTGVVGFCELLACSAAAGISVQKCAAAGKLATIHASRGAQKHH